MHRNQSAPWDGAGRNRMGRGPHLGEIEHSLRRAEAFFFSTADRTAGSTFDQSRRCWGYPWPGSWTQHGHQGRGDRAEESHTFRVSPPLEAKARYSHLQHSVGGHFTHTVGNGARTLGERFEHTEIRQLYTTHVPTRKPPYLLPTPCVFARAVYAPGSNPGRPVVGERSVCRARRAEGRDGTFYVPSSYGRVCVSADCAFRPP